MYVVLLNYCGMSDIVLDLFENQRVLCFHTGVYTYKSMHLIMVPSNFSFQSVHKNQEIKWFSVQAQVLSIPIIITHY